MKAIVHSVLVVLMVCGAASSVRADYYVAQDGQTETPPYTNGWTSAASNIQDAVNVATNSSTIWVGSGRYKAPPNAQAFLDTWTNVVVITNILTISGFSGNPADTIIDGEGKYRGVLVTNTTTRVNAFTLKSLTISNCFATNGVYGAAIAFCNGGQVINCVIANNNSTNGGVVNWAGSSSKETTTFSNCVIRNNWGSGIRAYYYYGQMNIFNSRLEYNTSSEGGGVYADHLDDNAPGLNIDRCVFKGNRANYIGDGHYGGGGVSISHSKSTIQNTLFCNNTSYGGGSAVQYNDSSSAGYMYNCTIASNSTDALNYYKGAVYFEPNCTDLGDFRMVNSIVYSNSANFAFYFTTGTVPSITNCCTTPTNGILNFVAQGNTTNNPQFVSVAGQDFHLRATSPCINTGTNQTWMNGATDLEGQPRKDRVSGIVDMGCYEYVARGTMFIIR